MPYIDERDLYDGSVRGSKRGMPFRNTTGGTLAAGTLVYISGWVETTYKLALVTKADADATGSLATYVVRSAVTDGSNGRLYRQYREKNANTAGSAVGDAVFLSATAGARTLTNPQIADPMATGQIVGRVAVVSATVGEIEIDLDAHEKSTLLGGVALAGGLIQYATGTITNTQMLALRATPKTLVAAPGAGKVLEFVSLALFFDYTAAYTETADNMAVKYTDGSGVAVSQTIEATGFVDATADTATSGSPKADIIVAKTGCDNKALVLHNTGDGEYGGGNAANSIYFRCAYRVHAAGW